MDDGQVRGVPPLWDDAAFVRRVEGLAAARGISIREACHAAGLAPDYLNHAAKRGGRTVEALLKLARALEVGVAELIGAKIEMNIAPVPEDSVKRLALVADIAAHLYVALSARGVAPPRSERLVRDILQMVGSSA